MKTKLANFRYLFLVFITGIILSSCSKDDNTDAIVGTWTAGTSTVSVMVGSQTLVQYALAEMGLTADEAAAFEALVDQSLKQLFTGTIQIKSDKTYTSNLGGTTDTGTWSLNSDRTELTINSTTDGPMTYEVIELTSSKLHLHAIETAPYDLNGDDTPETMTVEIDINFAK
jgi:hypothetical protein